jgi:uncharacterized protein (DUF4415 family)
MRKARNTSPRSVQAEVAALAATPDAAIDVNDIPEVRDWSGATRGRFYRPVKQVVTIRLDADVVAWFKQRDTRYQTAVNRVLREYMAGHAAPRKTIRSRTPTRAGRRAARG